MIFWGFGVMNSAAMRAAQKVGYPRDKIIGSWWAGSEEDTVPAGDAAKGYMSAAMNVSGKTPLIADIEKTLYGANPTGNMQDSSKIGGINYNRGVVIGILTVEAIRVAQAKYGKKVMDGEQIRWALEHLDLSDARLKAAERVGPDAGDEDELRGPRGIGQDQDPAVGRHEVEPGVGLDRRQPRAGPAAARTVGDRLRQAEEHHAAGLREGRMN